MGFWIFTASAVLSLPKQLAVVFIGVSGANGKSSTTTSLLLLSGLTTRCHRRGLADVDAGNQILGDRSNGPTDLRRDVVHLQQDGRSEGPGGICAPEAQVSSVLPSPGLEQLIDAPVVAQAGEAARRGGVPAGPRLRFRRAGRAGSTGATYDDADAIRRRRARVGEPRAESSPPMLFSSPYPSSPDSERLRWCQLALSDVKRRRRGPEVASHGVGIALKFRRRNPSRDERNA